MIYLLDSNAWISVFRGKNTAILQHLKTHTPDEIAHCPIVIAELWYGVCRSQPSYRAANEHLVRNVQAKYLSLPFDAAVAFRSAELRAELAATGTPIGPYDLLIAATAQVHGATLITANSTEFSRVSQLLTENWHADES